MVLTRVNGLPGLFQLLRDPLVEALTLSPSSHVNLAMQTRRWTKHQTPRKRLLRLLASLLAELQVVVYRVPKRPLQLFHALALERDHITHVQYLAVK